MEVSELEFVWIKNVDNAFFFCYYRDMATRILAFPAEDYFVAFLATRGIMIAAENAEVIHYFGTSKRKIKKLVAEHNPDLVVIHDLKAYDEDYKFPFALDEVSNDREIYEPKQVTTNALELTKLHYQSLGLERLLNDLTPAKIEKQKEKLKINSSVVKKVFHAMMWD